MQTTLDIERAPDALWLVLHTHYQTAPFVKIMERLGWTRQDGVGWYTWATPRAALTARRLLGKGLLVTQAASDWYRQATA